MIRKCYPEGKRKAFNVNYDDGVVQDVRFVRLLNRYGLKGTFNLNSALMREGFRWVHECGMTVTRLSPEECARLYREHEVASHTARHPYMHDLTEAQILQEMWEDRYYLEKMLGMEVSGFAVPFTYYSQMIADCAAKVGFEYARISEETNSFALSEDYYWWRGSKFHWDEDLKSFVDAFLNTDQELALCQIVGHSYDLDVMNMWDTVEDIFRRVSACRDVLPMTHIELVRYLRAMEMAEISDRELYNRSESTLWFEIDGSIRAIAPGDTISWDR